MDINELNAAHPMPWSYAAVGGNVFVTDAAGQQVQLFTMLDFVCSLTRSVARADKQAQQQREATPV